MIEQKIKPFKNTHVSTITANVNCPSIMMSRDIDAADLTAPAVIPNELLGYYTLNGLIPVTYRRHFSSLYFGDQALSHNWSEEHINRMIKDAANNQLRGAYGGHEVQRMREILSKYDLLGKNVLVVGTEIPWIEALTLAAGASKITTLEYGDIISSHPLIEALTPLEFHRRHAEGKLSFDVVISFMSLEHSGLGRYGDALNPWGDILAANRLWCVTKENGIMILGLPGGRQDGIVFNAHRVYGKYRWPLITANWIPDDIHQNIDEDFYSEQGKITVRIFRKAGLDAVAKN